MYERSIPLMSANAACEIPAAIEGLRAERSFDKNHVLVDRRLFHMLQKNN
jgi:hypothetical protein